MRIFINGFGRIGRSVLRAALLRHEWPGLEIVGVNDIAAPDLLAHLFAYDSTYGPFPGKVSMEGDALVVDDRRIMLHRTPDITGLDLAGVDLLMECTGKVDTPEAARRGLAAGAGRVLVSGPSQGVEATVVLGANDAVLEAGHRVLSNASCTTNALAPLARVLDEAFGLRTGWMTTIHCYTGSQPTIDAPRGDFARSRAAALSMVPTTTSASRLVEIVLPQLAGRLMASAVRVPTASVSAIDLTFLPARAVNAGEINTALRAAGGVIGWTDLPLVSSDLRARPESIVMALAETHVTEGGLARVFGWYDNEWGFACRMLDVAVRWR